MKKKIMAAILIFAMCFAFAGWDDAEGKTLMSC